MQEEYGQTSIYTYNEFVSLAGNHPAVSVAEAQFEVTAQNEAASSGISSDAYAGAN